MKILEWCFPSVATHKEPAHGSVEVTVIKLGSSSKIDFNLLKETDFADADPHKHGGGTNNHVEPVKVSRNPRCCSNAILIETTKYLKDEVLQILNWKQHFKQQSAKVWQPILSVRTIWKNLCILGLLIATMGSIMLASDILTAHEINVPYSSSKECSNLRRRIQQEKLANQTICTENCAHISEEVCSVSFTIPYDMYAPVYIFYEIVNFHQNHRKYTKSQDGPQLLGQIYDSENNAVLPYECSRYEKDLTDASGKIYYPCGSLASSMFSDKFTLTTEGGTLIPIHKSGISIGILKKLKYGQPPGMDPKLYDSYRGGSFIKDFTKPKHWSETEWKEWFLEGGVYNPDFINWMQPAPFSKVRKLYGIIKNKIPGCERKGVLCRGNYRMNILYRYDVDSFDGRKNFILATTSVFGTLNKTRSILTTCIGFFLMVSSIALYASQGRIRKSLRQARNLTNLTGQSPTHGYFVGDLFTSFPCSSKTSSKSQRVKEEPGLIPLQACSGQTNLYLQSSSRNSHSKRVSLLV